MVFSHMLQFSQAHVLTRLNGLSGLPRMLMPLLLPARYAEKRDCLCEPSILLLHICPGRLGFRTMTAEFIRWPA